jgi:hypothetical protein
MQESDKNALIQELNKLSEWWPDTKERMLEIAKVLLTDHFNYYPKSDDKSRKSTTKSSTKEHVW